jgi:hypothetical protein
MSPTYSQNKASIYRWVEKNRDHNRELIRKRKAKYDTWKRIQKEFNFILLDYLEN